MKIIKNGVRVVEEKVNLSSADLYSEAVIEYMRSYMDSLSVDHIQMPISTDKFNKLSASDIASLKTDVYI